METASFSLIEKMLKQLPAPSGDVFTNKEDRAKPGVVGTGAWEKPGC